MTQQRRVTMTPEQEREARTAEESGRQAEYVYGLISPYVEGLKKDHLRLMLRKYRDGDFDVRTELSAYCALEDVEEQIKYRIRTGRGARKELEEYGPERS